jgi:prepilin-type N-terminal cleavage/methylation domain-containing protein
MKRKSGFTLIELMVVTVIAAIGLFAVTTLLYSAYKDWFTSREIKALQEDMDLASLTVKSVLEEAEWGDGMEDNITEDHTGITLRGRDAEDNEWTKEFRKDGSELILKDMDTGDEYIVVKTLHTISFYESDVKYPDEEDERHGLHKTLFVEITVAGAGRIADRKIENQFFVRLRN